VLEQTQSSNAEAGVKDIHHVARPIGKTSQFGILKALAFEARMCGKATYLALQNELGQLVAIDPVQLAEHGHAAHHPPAVAHVLLLLRSAIQSAVLELSFA
jgi:hypothetical protein